jgi:hypothetical protein
MSRKFLIEGNKVEASCAIVPLAVSIPEAARLVGLSPHTIRWYIRQEKISPIRFGRRLAIPMLEIERLAKDGIA